MTSLNEFDSVWAPPGKAMDDRGATHDRVQDAVDNAQSFVMVGPGTFPESVVVDTPGLSLRGAGAGSLIDGGEEGSGLDIQASDVNVDQLSAQTAKGVGADYTGINVSDDASEVVLRLVRVPQSDTDGIRFGGEGCALIAAAIDDTESSAVRVSNAAVRANIGLVTTGPSVSGDGVSINGDYCNVGLCNIRGPGANGINVGPAVAGAAVGLNTVVDAGQIGIRMHSQNGSLIGNVVSGSVSDDIDVSDATNLQYAANQPEIPRGRVRIEPTADIPVQPVPDQDHVEVPVHVPEGRTLNVWTWGARTDQQTTPDGLYVQVYNYTTDTLMESSTASLESGEPIAEMEASGGPADGALRLRNETGGEVNAGAIFDYTIDA